MKVLFVMDSPGAGGAERSTADLWYFLRDESVALKVIFLNTCTPGIREEIEAAGFDVSYLDGLNLIKQSRAIARKIREFQPDVVHSILFKSNLRTRLARFWQRFIHIESLVNCTYDKIRLQDPNVSKLALMCYKLLDKYTSFLVDHYHAITETVKDHYRVEIGIDPSKVTVVYRGRNSPVKAKLERHALGCNEEDFVIINTARHEFQKGQIFLIQAVKDLVEEGYGNIKLLILGRDGNATRSIREYIEMHSLNANIILLGFRTDAGEVLASGDLFAFPSLYEGLGGALIEAQAAGLPVICNDLPVFKEVVLEGQNAKVFNVVDKESITKAIMFFYLNKEQRLSFGQKSKENFEHKFTMDNVNREMLSLYSNLKQLVKQ